MTYLARAKEVTYLVRATVTDGSAWIGNGELPWISSSGKKKEKSHPRPIGGGSRGELLAALPDNPPLVPLQLPNAWQGFAIAAVSHGFLSALQTGSAERAGLIPLGSVRAVPRVLGMPGCRAQLPAAARGGCCCPKLHAGAGLQLRLLGFQATFSPEVPRPGSTMHASCPSELGAGSSAAGGRINLSACFSPDPSLDLIRHSSW